MTCSGGIGPFDETEGVVGAIDGVVDPDSEVVDVTDSAA